MALPNENSLLKKEHREEPEIEVEIEGEGIELDVVDDTPAEDRNRKPLPEGEAEPTDEEMEQYSESVKKRISKMKHGLHDERRAKEQAARERDEAIAIGQKLYAEKKALEARNIQGEDTIINHTKEKADLAMLAAKKAYKEAYELGDAEAMANAQERIATVSLERKQADDWARNSAQRAEIARQEQNTVVQRQQPARAQAPEPEPEAKDWATKNKWFGTDKRMTNMAYAIHDELIEDGVDPGRDSDTYYKRLNKSMREVFPSYEWSDTKKKPTSVVAAVNRTSKAATRVTLTQSQVAVAKRMGITPLQYAVELAKLER